MSFVGDLAIGLTLTIAGQAYTIPGGNVKSVRLDVGPCGFSGAVSFIVSPEMATDKLFTPFGQSDLIEVALQAGVSIKPPNAESQTLSVTGLATAKGFREQTLANVLPTQSLMVSRLYHLDFADPAQVLWKQHYPCGLLTETTLKDLLAAHTGDKITLTCDWTVLDQQCHLLALPLGLDDNSASFYDFVIWLAYTQNGVFSYDAANNTYSLTAQKAAASDPKALNALEVASHAVEFPPTCRYQPNVLNAYSESPQTQAVTNEQMVSPMRRDYLGCYSIPADMQNRITLETARFKQRLHEVSVCYSQFPLYACQPGQAVNFQGAGWSTSLFVSGKTYRVRSWQFAAESQAEGMQDYDMDFSHYAMDLELRLESSDETWVDLPPFKTPAYPMAVEGKIVSEQGGDQDATYQSYQDPDTSAVYYQVTIPLWSNLKIRAAFLPNLATGQFYFPLYKNARVQVELGFQSAAIVGHLDWGNGVAMAMDTQGNQLVMGKSTTSQTSLQHAYVDEKPQLQLQRLQDKDTELLQFSDGYILLQTQTQEG